MALQKTNTNPLKWYNPKEKPFRISGLAWFDKDKLYQRLPVKPSHQVPKIVSYLAGMPAGAQLSFKTNSKRLAIRVKLEELEWMEHMTVTGQGGFDCYLGNPGRQKYVSTARFGFKTDYEFTFFEFDEPEMRSVTLNFPLYQGVKSIEIGLNENAKILSAESRISNKRIIFYGTSITQGGCASRPGMAYTNILSRRFNYEFINLGFSGNGKGEPELARIITEIKNPGCFVLDYEANCVSTENYKVTLPNFIKILREKHPLIPIILISQIPVAKDYFEARRLNSKIERRKFSVKLIKKLKKAGDKNIYFIDGSKFFGKYTDECTVDGVHPTDLGFMKMADALTPVFKKLIKNNKLFRK